MARGISYHDANQWQLCTDVPFCRNGYTFESPSAIFRHSSGEWRQVFPPISSSTSFFLNPFSGFGAKAMAGLTGTPQGSSPFVISNPGMVGAKARGTFDGTPSNAIQITMPSFLVANPMTFNGRAWAIQAYGSNSEVIQLTCNEFGNWIVGSSFTPIIEQGSWGLPTGGLVGPNYWFRFIRNSVSASGATYSDPSTNWQKNDFGLGVSVLAQADGNSTISANYTCQIATDAAGTNIIAQGTFVLRSDHFFMIDNPQLWNGQGYSDSQNANGVPSVCNFSLFPDGAVRVAVPGNSQAVYQRWGLPVSPTNPPGSGYQVRFTRIAATVSGGATADASTGWLPLSSQQGVQVYSPQFANSSVSATYTVEIYQNSTGGVVTSSIVLNASYTSPITNLVLPVNGTVRSFSPARPVTVSFSLRGDGTSAGAGNNVNTISNWYTGAPVSGIGNSHWVRVTLLSGDAPNTGTSQPLNTWLQLSALRTWGYTTNGFREGTFQVDVAGDAGGSAILSTGQVVMSAEWVS